MSAKAAFRYIRSEELLNEGQAVSSLTREACKVDPF